MGISKKISLQCPQLFTVFLDVSSTSHKKNRRKFGRKYVKVFCFFPPPPLPEYVGSVWSWRFGCDGLLGVEPPHVRRTRPGDHRRRDVVHQVLKGEVSSPWVGGMSFTRSLKAQLNKSPSEFFF